MLPVVCSHSVRSCTVFREGPSCSTSNSKLNNPKQSFKENEVVYGDFLKLAPPTTTSTCPSSKFKHPSACLASYNHKFPDFESLPYQVRLNNKNPNPISHFTNFMFHVYLICT